MPFVTSKTFAPIAALAVGLAVASAPRAAVAQATASTQTSAQTSTQTSTQSSAAAKVDDPTIVAIFDAANTWDVETGDVALRKSHNKDVRAFARMMVRDHKAVRQLGRDLAHKLNVTPTPPGKDFALYQDHLAALKTLRNAHGAAFDKAYIDHEVTYHQAVIDAITNTLLPATQNADLKKLEVQVAPSFQAHLVAAKQVQQKLESK